MTGTTLLPEFAAAADKAVNQARRLAALGITGAAVAAVGSVGIARIEVDGPHYAPSPEGQWALVVPVRAAGGELTDLVAFQTARPDTWWLRLDVVPLLGMAAVERADYLELPLNIYANPLAWLRAEGNGVVILDWRCCLSFWLSGTPRLIVHDPRTWQLLTGALHRPPANFNIKLAHDEADHDQAA